MITLFFGLALGGALVIVAAGLVSAVAPEWRFWPPPAPDSMQYRLFWWPFRAYLAGLVGLAVLEVTPPVEGTWWWRIGFGIALCAAGFGVAVVATIQLGWANAHGAQDGLQTGGLYRWSRNPVYVATLVGLVGLALIVNSSRVSLLLGFWGVLYVLAPFAEEPWMEERYGDAYRDYRRSVHRFVGRPGRKRNRV